MLRIWSCTGTPNSLNKEWIIIHGHAKKVGDIYSEDLLNAGYDNNPNLFELLGIHNKNKSIIELGGTEEQQKDYETGRQLREAGITQEDINRLLKSKREKIVKDKERETNKGKTPNIENVDDFYPKTCLMSL